MKYVISNAQVFEVIYSFLESEFKDIFWEPGFDYTRDEDTDDLIFFRLPDYDYDVVFEYTKKTWYTREFDSPIKGKTRESQEFIDMWLPKAPMINFADSGIELKVKFITLFGDYWKPVFEKWFEDHYPQFPVKTFIY